MTMTFRIELGELWALVVWIPEELEQEQHVCTISINENISSPPGVMCIINPSPQCQQWLLYCELHTQMVQQ